MNADEQYVRENWELVAFYSGEGDDNDEEFDSYEVRVAGRAENALPFWDRSADKVWSAAAAYTRARREEIRRVEEEIAWMKLSSSRWHGHLSFVTEEMLESPKKRIIVSLESVLASLKRGLKEQA